MEPVQFGRYRLEEQLAVGGMAEIFRAKSFGLHGFEKTLAIKRILPSLTEDSEFVTMFIDEARMMTQLSHPKIVQVHDFGEVDGQYYIAMEYVEGLDLLELLRTCAKRRVRPTTAIAVHVIAEVLDALDFAHTLCAPDGRNLGIVHADISPSNVFISWQGGIKLGDFGIARALGTKGSAETGALRGKYGYMSPEQVSGQPLDARADVFAAGIVLAELLMIRRLFIAQNDLDVLLQVRDARLDRLYKYGKRIPPDLMAILESALARDPDLRYQSVGVFRDALHRYLFDNRRMVRGADVRRFLARLCDDSTPIQAGAEGQGISPLAAHHAREERDLPPGVDRKPLVELDQPSTTPPVASPSAVTPPVAAPPMMGGSRDMHVAALDGGGAMPAPLAEMAEAVTGSAEHQASVGRKRRIQLSPPPAPRPVPQGLPHTGEEPRLTTHHALAAVPELGVPGGSSNRDFRSLGEAEGPETPIIQDIKTPVEPESVAASRQITPIEGIPTMAAPDRRGALADESLFAVMFGLAVKEDTGLLLLRRDDAVKEIYLVDGHPHYVSSNQAEELFGQYLVSKGVIAGGELSMALAMLPHFGGRLGDTLVALKLMRPMQVLRHLTHQVREKLLDAFNWSTGGYLFYRDKQCANESAPLGLDAYELLGAGVQRIPRDIVQQRLADQLKHRLRTNAPPPVPPEVFRLGGLPRQAHDKLSGQHTLAELLDRFDDPRQRESFERVVFLLLETGLAS